MNYSKLKYICSSFASNISTGLLTEEKNEKSFYEVYGASGLLGFYNVYYSDKEYLGIIKDGAGVGRINKYPKKSSILGTMAYIIPNKETDIDWLKYCIQSLNLADSLDKTTIPHIYFSEYGNEKVAIFDMEKQKRIAIFLDTKCLVIDQIITLLKDQIETLEQYKKSIISESIKRGIRKKDKYIDSGVDWIGKIPENWELKRGKYILQFLQRPVFRDDGVITCFRDGEVTLRSNRREEGFTMSEKEIGYQGIDSGDLVVHGMDGFAGAIGISDSRGKGSPVLNVLDSNQNKKYIMYYLRSMAYSDVFVALATGIRVRSCDLRWNKLAELLYPVPPLEEQKEIVDFIETKCNDTNNIIQNKKNQIDCLEKYKKSLIYEYVNGKKEVAL